MGGSEKKNCVTTKDYVAILHVYYLNMGIRTPRSQCGPVIAILSHSKGINIWLMEKGLCNPGQPKRALQMSASAPSSSG